MKKSFTFLFAALILSATGYTQSRPASPHPSVHKERSAKKGKSTENTLSRSQLSVIKSTIPAKKGIMQTDTLNYPLQGQYELYISDGGYVSGNNEFDDKAKAEVFNYGTPSLLTGVLIDFAVATSNDTDIEIAAWNNGGTGGSPGTKIGSTTISLNDIFLDVLNEQTTYIPFETPILMTSTFYVGVILPGGADTVAIFTNTDGDTDPATAWEQWNDNQWYTYDNMNSWGLKVAHAIFPIVNSEVDLTANFFAGEPTLMPGESTTFYDSSLGDPISWEWTFEGGTPATSGEQSPLVTYEQEGLYDVTLVVGDGETYDTLTRADYIFVTNEIPVEVDTLLYPLEGLYTVLIVQMSGQNVGYVCGNNVFNDLAKANYYNVPEDVKITGLLFDFALAVGNNPSIDLNIYNNNGNGGGPGSILASGTVEMNTIISNIANNQMTFVSFDNTPVLTHPFYAGFTLPTAAGDTLAVYSNEDGDTFPGVAWEWWEDGTWYPMTHQDSWGLNIAMAIHPVVEYQTGIRDVLDVPQIPVFPNPASGLVTLDLSAFPSTGGVEILNLDGRTLATYQVQPGEKTMELDLSGFPAGTYLVRITGKEERGIQKIIVH